MNSEKKLGLAFVGILSVAFCGVLTMRLLDANKAEQIDISVGPAVGSAPTFDPAKNDPTKTDPTKTYGSATASARPAMPAAPQPPESRYATAANPATANSNAPRSGSYLPPLPKSPTTPAGDSRYGSSSTAAAPSMPSSPYGSSSAGISNTPNTPNTPAAAAPMSNPYASTGSRYGTPTAPTMPSTPTAAPNFASATPTAAATLTPTTTPATSTATGSPYGMPTAAMPNAAIPSAAPSTAASLAASGDNPLRSSRSFDLTSSTAGGAPSTASSEPGLIGSGGASASISSSSGGYSAPNIPSAAAPPSIPTSTLGGTPAAPATSANPYATPATPYAAANPSTGSPSFAAAPATNLSTTTSSPREPRAFDTSAMPTQPLSTASPVAPSQASSGFNNGFTNTNALRSSNPTASPAGGIANNGLTNSGTATGSVAPAAATLPVAAPTVKNTPYVVQPNDNFWNISTKVYGDGSYYRALFAYNSDRYAHAEDVRAGSVLDVPPAEVLKQRYPELVNGGVGGDGRPTDSTLAGGKPAAAAAATYLVRDGDTLFDIARRQLGKASRWNEIYELNRAALGENLENLRPGMQIQLPQ